MGLLSFFGLTDKRIDQAVPSKDELSSGSDPFDDYWYGPPSIKNASGIRVDEAVALTYSACWASTRLLCGTGGMLPFNLLRYLPGGGSEVAFDHPVQRIIHDEPNTEMSSMTFRSSRMNHQVNRGNCFAEIGRNRGGQVMVLYPIHASRIPTRSNIIRRNGRLLYLVNNDDGSKTEIKQENMFHVPSIITNDGVVGLGVVENAALTIGFGLATETHGAAFFGNSGRPSTYLKNGKFRKPEDSEEFRRQWMNTHGGPMNAGKIALLPPESDIGTLPFNAQEAQYLESRQHTVEEIARWYGVPPHLIGHLLRATFGNIEHQGIEFVKYSLMPWLKLWECEVWRKLLTKEEQKTYYAKFNVDALERGDKTSRTTASVQEFFNGLLTLNKWAEREDMNPIGPLGDLHFVQQAMVPLEVAAKGPQATTDPNTEQGPSQGDEIRQSMDTYGIGVRAGSITPQLNDEEQFRQALGLPPMTDDAKAAWTEDKGIRRPITLRDPNAPASPFQPGPPSDKPPADDPEDEPTPEEDGLSALREQFEALQREHDKAKQAQQRIASAMLRDAMARMLSIEIHSVKHITEKPNKFDQRLRDFYDKHAATMTRSLSEPVSVFLTATGDVRQPSEVVSSITSSHVTESLRQLDSLLDCTADELPSKVEACLSTWHDERATVSV